MPWLELGLLLLLLAVIGLVVRYARSDAKKGSELDASKQTEKVAKIMAAPASRAEDLDALRKRRDARARRRRMRRED